MLALLACSAGFDSAKDDPRGRDTVAPAESACSPTVDVLPSDILGPFPFTADFSLTTACAEGEVGWDFGDGELATGPTATHTWHSAGDYLVTATITLPDGEIQASERIRVTTPDCPALGESVQVGNIASAELIEASGLAVGVVTEGLLWSHNDSGDGPRLYALDPDGTDRGAFVLDGAPDGDWEDLASATLDGVPVLLAGDIGQNGEARATSTIYVVPEPAVDAEATIYDWWAFDLAFPDADTALDANAMLWDPVDQALWIAGVEADQTGLYRAAAPFVPGEVRVLERVTALDFGGEALPGESALSGGAASPEGDRLLWRTGAEAWLWWRDPAQAVADTWATAACPLDLPEEEAGEAVAFDAAGAGIYTTGEAAGHPIFYTPFLPVADPCDGPAVGIVHDATSYGIPFSPTFSIDDTCLLAGVASVSWDLDGESSTELHPSRTWLASGDHEVSATVIDGDGSTWNASLEFTVVGADCPVPGEATSWGDVDSDEIVEASGLGQSARDPDVLWTHNDSGDVARLFAMDRSGADLGEYTVDTTSTDWEDLTLGWDALYGADAIYVGDFGDNGESRDHVELLVLPEPEVDGAGGIIEDFSTMILLYPDDAHNAETLMRDPVSGDLYVVTKDYDGPSYVFRKPAPHADDSETELELVAELLFGEAPLEGGVATTSGDFSPLGDRIAVRTYDHAWMWRRDQAFSLAEAFAGEPCDLGAPDEEQGEALAFTQDGAGYLVVSEGEHPPIWYVPLD